MPTETASTPTTPGFRVLPAGPGVCPACAIDHPAHWPHKNESLHYQYWFYARHGRFPTYADAMAHCDDRMKDFWLEKLPTVGKTISQAEIDAATATFRQSTCCVDCKTSMSEDKRLYGTLPSGEDAPRLWEVLWPETNPILSADRWTVLYRCPVCSPPEEGDEVIGNVS